MAEREFQIVDLSWDGQLMDAFLSGRALGYRLEAISLAGVRGGALPVLAALTWVQDDGGPTQLLGEFVEHDEIPRQVRRLRESGFGAALVAAVRTSTGGAALCVVYERVDVTAANWPRLLFTSRSYDAFWLECFDKPEGDSTEANKRHYLRSAGVLDPLDDEDPLFIGTLWPYGDETFDWGLTYWKWLSTESFFIESSQRAKAMAVAGRPWIVAPAYPKPRNYGYSRRFLTMWRDQFFSPWPAPLQPFDRTYRREVEIQIDWVSYEQLEAKRAERASQGMALHTWAVRGTGGRDVHFALNWLPYHWPLQTRTFIMTGPGNLDGATDTRALRFVGDVAPRADRVTRPWARALHVGVNRPVRVGARFSMPRPDPPGTPGDLPDWEHNDPEYPSVDPLHPFDLVMVRWMKRNGLRAGQLAVNRSGELRFSRAYTWAETGYPITKTYHRMRSGSVSKAVTALLVAPHYMRRKEANPADLGLERWFEAELGISRSEHAFGQITISQALSHTSGMSGAGLSYDEIVQLLRPEDTLGYDEDGVLRGTYVPVPGEMRKTFEVWPTPLVDLPEGANGFASHYNNFVYCALGELWSGISTGTDWDRYDNALRNDLFGPANITVDQAHSGTSYAECNARNEVAYHPHTLGIFRNNRGSPDRWLLSPYPPAVPFSASLAVSMREQARILALLTPRDGVTPIATLQQKQTMAGYPSPDSFGPVLGWDGTRARNLVPLGGGAHHHQDTMIWPNKNGAAPGTTAWITHWFPGVHSSYSEETTVDIAVAFNGDVISGQILDELVDAAVDVEARDLWSPVDLTDGSDFDEEEP